VTYQNLTATSIHVFWSPPAEPNGIIDNYTVEYMELPTGENFTKEGIRATMADLTGLMEYERYIVVVYAFTDKGRGEGSDQLMVRTLEHFPDEPTNFNVAPINSTALNASWGAPVDPNGILEGYQLCLELIPEDAAYLGSPNLNFSEDDLSLVIDMLHPFATYRLAVRAVTSVGPGNQTVRMATTTEDGKLGLCLTFTILASSFPFLRQGAWEQYTTDRVPLITRLPTLLVPIA